MIISQHREKFESIREFIQQSAHLSSMIRVSKYTTGSYKFTFEIPDNEGVFRTVCRIAFMNIFSLGSVKLTNLTKRMTGRYGEQAGAEFESNLSIPHLGIDGRGRSSAMVPNRTDPGAIEEARSFVVEQIIVFGVPSHYRQSQNSSKNHLYAVRPVNKAIMGGISSGT